MNFCFLLLSSIIANDLGESDRELTEDDVTFCKTFAKEALKSGEYIDNTNNIRKPMDPALSREVMRILRDYGCHAAKECTSLAAELESIKDQLALSKSQVEELQMKLSSLETMTNLTAALPAAGGNALNVCIMQRMCRVTHWSS